MYSLEISLTELLTNLH